MHLKSDSEETIADGHSWPPRSPPRRPLYYVQSPSNHDVEKLSYGSGSPMGSPNHNNHYYHSSPIHHSRESSTSRFSASLKNTKSLSAYKNLQVQHDGVLRKLNGVEDDDDDMDENNRRGGRNVRLYCCLFLLFILLFTLFSLILWASSKAYSPKIIVKGMVFESINVQAGSDKSGVPTDMLSLNSTVRISYNNPGTFFSVHVTSTPLELHYFQLKLASGQMEKFSQSRKSHRRMETLVQANQVPLYGGVPLLVGNQQHIEKVALPMNLTFKVRSRAYILGQLVKSKFYKSVRCSVTLRGNGLGKFVNLNQSCIYQ